MHTEFDTRLLYVPLVLLGLGLGALASFFTYAESVHVATLARLIPIGSIDVQENVSIFGTITESDTNTEVVGLHVVDPYDGSIMLLSIRYDAHTRIMQHDSLFASAAAHQAAAEDIVPSTYANVVIKRGAELYAVSITMYCTSTPCL